MSYVKIQRPGLGLREDLKFWIGNILLVGACLWTFLLLGGCKTPDQTRNEALVVESKDDITDYLNNSVKEVTPPEIMNTNEPFSMPDDLKDSPPINPQVNASF